MSVNTYEGPCFGGFVFNGQILLSWAFIIKQGQKLPPLSACCLFCFGRRKRPSVEGVGVFTSPLPQNFHLSWILISRYSQCGCHWQQKRHMTEKTKFSCMGPTKVIYLSRIYAFSLSLAYRWTPAWSRIGLCYKLNRLKLGGNLLHSLLFGVSKNGKVWEILT